jgi:hypothetical protein
MKKLLLGVPLLGWLALASACATHVKAKAPIERPNLDVPPPPPRVVEPAPVPDTTPEPVPDLPPAPAPAKPRPPQPRPQPSEPKAESKPEQAPAESGTPAAAPPPNAPQLRTPQTADGTDAERTVRATIERARNVLNTVNFNPLSNERKKAYNDAKAYIQTAEDAAKNGNYAYAQSLANKAETLATELAGK